MLKPLNYSLQGCKFCIYCIITNKVPITLNYKYIKITIDLVWVLK